MKIGLRILLGYFLIVGLAAWFLLNVFVDQVRPGVRATLEDTLVDTANLLAAMVADDVKQGRIEQPGAIARMRDFSQRGVTAKINGVTKGSLDYRVYITDARGVVLFDSSGRDVGKDYSQWNDVYATLHGKYGARSTRTIPDDDASTVMHVAAPVKDGDKLIGVLTVAKPIATVQPFVERSQQKILRRGAVLLGVSLAIGMGFAFWLSRSLRALMHYIGQVEAGAKATLPALGNNEIGTLGRALETMRHKLEGKEYVEELMHTLAHELKSPIAAIQASAELLGEDMPAGERDRFLATILEQNARQRALIDKLLALVRVEKQQRLQAPEPVAMPALLAQVAADFAHCAHITVDCDEVSVRGDALLLRQAIGNLVDNAAAFAPAGAIALACRREGARLHITVRDQGPGIPDFARERLFERFYSLPRPDGGRSSGLGLPFVREVAVLHGGSATVRSDSAGGACAELLLPVGDDFTQNA
ncbi:MAG: two-component system sensor histidine kinase CreC [Pseudomonadota bacterium]